MQTTPQSGSRPDALMRLPAAGEAEGSLLINPGGPGGSGTSFVASSLPLWQASPVAERFDIVGFDPRGVGSSTPALDCYTDEEYDAGDVPRFGAVYDITSAEEAAELAERCADGSGGIANLVNAGSTSVVRDMDITRKVLGDDQLTYLGYSYGSELGAMYAATYPEKVRAIVLDGAVSPDETASESRLSSFAGLQARFDDLAALCTESPDCVLGPDPAAANDRLHEIVQPLVETPAATADGRDVSVWDVYLGISGGLYSEAKWPEVISALTALEAGNADSPVAACDTLDSGVAAPAGAGDSRATASHENAPAPELPVTLDIATANFRSGAPRGAGHDTRGVLNRPLSWVLQNESALQGPGAAPGSSAQLEVTWVAAYAYGWK